MKASPGRRHARERPAGTTTARAEWLVGPDVEVG